MPEPIQTIVSADIDPATHVAATPPAGTPPAAIPPAEGTPPIDAPVSLDVEPPAPPAPPTPKEGERVVVEYAPTGNAALDVTLGFLGNLGLTAADPAMVAAGNGDYSALEAKLAAMGDSAKGWERYVAAGKEAYSKVDTERKETAAKNRELVETAAGGKESWAAVQAWASAKAEPAEKVSINAALAAGGIAAKAMAVYLARTYESSPEYTKKGKDARGIVAPTPASGTAPMTAREYSDQVQALHTKFGGRMTTTPEYAALRARRLAAK